MDPNDPEEAARRKKTMLLLAGGAASLVIPLLAVLYLRWSENRSAPKQVDPQGLFQAREGERRIMPPSAQAMSAAVAVGVPAQSPSAAPPPLLSSPMPGSKSAEGSGSLGFIKPSEDYYSKTQPPTAAPKKEEAKPAPPPPAEPKPAAKTASKNAKPAKKSFAMPKLNTTKGFTSFKRNQPGAEAPSDDGGGDMSEMLKQLPPGAENNPDLQKYLKSQGK